MNLNTDIKTLADAIGGKIIKGSGNTPFNSFKTDSRKIQAGDFLLALKGSRYNAHDFLENTLLSGVKGWIVNENKISKLKDLPDCLIAVDDTLKALHKLALFHRRKFNIPIIAITGSNGKTTVKQMLLAILSRQGKTRASEGNFNNQYGLPFSVLELDEKDKFGIFELGASRKGDIEELAIIAKPTTAIITNIAPAHLEFFGDLETIYQTKTELVGHISKDGCLVYNSDDAFLRKLKNHAVGKLSFGANKEADIMVSSHKGRFNLSVKKTKEEVIVNLPVSGRHNQMNAAAAAAAALSIGISLNTVKLGLEAFKPAPMRMQVFKSGKLIVIFDAYNANPESMKTALTCLAAHYPPPYHLVLGDMKELGPNAEKYHSRLGDLIAKKKFDSIFLAGYEMKSTYKKLLKSDLASKTIYARDCLSWLKDIKEICKTKKGTMLIKASRAMNFEKILEEISKTAG